MKSKMILSIAKPIIKNKYWIVEKNGEKIGTIQAIDDLGGFVYVQDSSRRHYPSISLLKKTHNIKIDDSETRVIKNKKPEQTIAFPHSGKAYNVLLDVKHGVTIFTKEPDSKSFYCAGYYAIKSGRQWTLEFCPKLITINRHEFQGPFTSRAQAQAVVKERNQS
jgi:hypothetical protein